MKGGGNRMATLLWGIIEHYQSDTSSYAVIREAYNEKWKAEENLSKFCNDQFRYFAVSPIQADVLNNYGVRE